MILCVTGPTDPPLYEPMLPYYRRSLEAIEIFADRTPRKFMSGAANGIDTDLVRAAMELWPSITIVFACPNAPHNEAFVQQVQETHHGMVEVHKIVSNDPSIGKRYMARNDWMANQADRLAAYPYNRAEMLRSGTWATIRRFRKLDKPTHLFPLNERIP